MRWLMTALCLAAACGPVDLVVVDVPDAGDLPSQVGAPCSDNDDCLGGQFCSMTSCSETVGNCVPRPTLLATCSDDFRPECGCDGVQYFNDCYRRYAGIAANEARGFCNPLLCDANAPCPDGASCAQVIRPNECGRAVSGMCWVVPSTSCVTMEHFFACGNATQCLDFCSAVRAGTPMAKFPGPCL